MKTRTTLAAIVSFVAGLAIAYAADSPMMGTWKLNDAKSKFGAGATKNHTVVYAPQGDSVKITVDGTTPQGKAVHGALPRLGFDGVTDVRQGKRFELELSGEVTDEVLEQVRQMAETLLSNPVIENYEVRVEQDA